MPSLVVHGVMLRWWRVITLATLLVLASSAAWAADAAGTWSLVPAGAGRWWLTLESPKGTSKRPTSQPVTSEQLRPRTDEQSGIDDGFRLRRDAGSIVAWRDSGVAESRGRFELLLAPGYADTLAARGVGRPSTPEQVQLALLDGSYATLDALRDHGPGVPRLEMFVRLLERRVDAAWLTEMAALGYPMASFDACLKARERGVDPVVVRALASAGYPRLTSAQILKACGLGVDSSYVAQLRQRGFKDVPIEQVMKAREHGVDAEFMRRLDAQGVRVPTLPQWIELRDQGVDGPFVSGIRAAGYSWAPVRDLIDARTHGVDGPYLAALQQAGYFNVPIRDAIRARDRGVDAGFAARARVKLGRQPSLDELIRLRDGGELE